MRRQNRSCDQCRRSKRACEIASSSAGVVFDAVTPSSDVFLDNQPVSCSYCLKTNKGCTFNWAKAQAKLPQRSQGSSETDFRSEPFAPAKRRRTSSSATQRLGSLEAEAVIPKSIFPNLIPNGSISNDGFVQGTESSWLGNFHSPQQGVLPALPMNFGLPEDGALQYNQHDLFHPEMTQEEAYAINGAFDLSSTLPSASTQPNTADVQAPSWTASQSQPTEELEEEHAIASSSSRNSLLGDMRDRTLVSSLSPYSPEFTMLTTSNNYLISDNLLHIYHDVLEHNLSCWLTEETCPYAVQPTTHPQGFAMDNNRLEQGATWTNRIYSRVIRLDKYAMSTKMIHLSRNEDIKASKALDLSIMAFASQWAQGSNRERKQYSHPRNHPLETEGFADGFDRNIQKSLWEQARQALMDVADVESFRVVCAELIFGLSQRPWDVDEMDTSRSSATSPGSLHQRLTKSSLLAELRDAIAKDGVPTHMERAARKMHALKFRWEAKQAGLHGKDDKATGKTGHSAPTVSDVEHEQTVALVYWLAVMFDTVSSSMNERPVVVGDEDSQHRQASYEPPETSDSSLENHAMTQRWSMKLFIQDNPDGPMRRQRWPCTYDEAAEAVTRSAPVKVLLYRQLSYFQNVLRKRLKGKSVEDIINSTMSLYRYWNMTHGAFFRDLVRAFPSVPPRIQSWFFCISAHWHLAVLMFADLIDFADQNGFGTPENTQNRFQTGVARRIRKMSAGEISELAAVATAPNAHSSGWRADGSSVQQPNFHFAVNKHTILTEPWTIIVIRAFTKAGAIHLSQAEDLWQTGLTDLYHEGETCQESLRRCEDCIKGLWLLGKKSDMARSTAKILSTGYNEVLREIGPLDNGNDGSIFV